MLMEWMVVEGPALPPPTTTNLSKVGTIRSLPSVFDESTALLEELSCSRNRPRPETVVSFLRSRRIRRQQLRGLISCRRALAMVMRRAAGRLLSVLICSVDDPVQTE